MKPARMYIPTTASELKDFLASMRLSAPRFEDVTGYLPFLNLEYVFKQLTAGLEANRLRLGEPRYNDLVRMSDQMRVLFEADPDDKTGQTHEGCMIILAMEDMLRQPKRRS